MAGGGTPKDEIWTIRQDWVPTRGTPTGDVFRVGAARCGRPRGDFSVAGLFSGQIVR